MTVTVEEILDRAVSEGYLTPAVAAEGPAHSVGFLRFGPLDGVSIPSGWSDLHGSGVVGPPAGALAVDLGTGGGIPGLVLATLTMCRWVLVDRGERRGGQLGSGPGPRDLPKGKNPILEFPFYHIIFILKYMF